MPSSAPPSILTLLLMGLAAAAAIIFVLTLARPGHGGVEPDLEDLAARSELALRRLLVRFRPRAGEVWYRWALAARQPELAVAFLEEAARKEHLEAHFELGLFYEEGGQGAGARERAARHYRAAAEGGHAEASFRLAELLRWGIGPARDPGAAHRWYLRSANGGFRPAVQWLVKAYEDGEGVPEDLEKAVFWMVRAKAMPPVGLRVSHFVRPHPGEHTAAVGPGAPTAPDRAERGETCFQQAMSFLGGDSSHPRDVEAAKAWLLRAAEAGHLDAMAALGELLMQEQGGLAHAPEARAWFQRAGDAGHRGAQIKLGQLDKESLHGMP
jgi:hypothetical protein